MKPEAQRIAIAEACGYVWSGLRAEKDAIGWKLNSQYIPKLPDYLNDLNAMHEAVGSLPGDQVVQFCEHLNISTGAGFQSLRIYQMRSLIMATAAQRAEAFLRTIGKWEESP